MSFDLFKHNKDAYGSALSMLAEHGKAAVVHPTGTGKSFIGFKLCEDFPDKVVCWLSPSEYIFRTQIENLKTVSGGWQPENIVFFTYAKLMMMSEEDISEIKPDYIILDEFHRCGAEQWGKGVERLISFYPNAQILGLSATAIRYLDNQRDMADELFGGNIASEMTLGEAIVRGILNPPKYVMSVFAYQKDYDRLKTRVRSAKNKAVRDEAERYLEALRRTLDMVDGLDVIFDKHMTDRAGKYIVFCSNLEHMTEMRGKAYEWFAKIDNAPHIYTAYSDDPTASKAFNEFKKDNSDHLKLLFCIDMLNEGVHVDDVSGVILFRPTVSPIIYKQQIGRALSANKNCVPVIFDIVNNIENLYSIGTIQQEMQVAVNYYRYIGESEYIVNEHFKVIDEVRDAKALFEQLNDTLTASWDTMYGYAEQYYAEHSNLEIPRRYKTADGYSLGNWIFTQRSVYAGEQYGSLDEVRVKKLEDIGMVWDSIRDLSWKRFYAEAEKYKNTYGDLKVPAKYVTDDGIRLGQWIANLRVYRKSGIKAAFMSKDRIEQLDKLGMIWEVNDYLWDDNYAECAKYYRAHGDLDLKINDVTPDGIRIGLWLSNQRKRRKEGKLTEEQIVRLDSIGMQWGSAYERKWDEGIAEARRYYAEHGDLNVPTSYVSPTGFKLGDWISNRREYGRDKLSEERKKQLDSIGMRWNLVGDRWQEGFEKAREYLAMLNGAKWRTNYVSPDGFKTGEWLRSQIRAYNTRGLPERKIKLLESIGILLSADTISKPKKKAHQEDSRRMAI